MVVYSWAGSLGRVLVLFCLCIPVAPTNSATPNPLPQVVDEFERLVAM